MANLAIKGHATRGKEIIKLLEMLGGKNDNHCCGGFINRIYFINENGYIESCDKMDHLSYFRLSLEEFHEKFPYKVGDKVKHAKINDIVGRITDARWDNKECQVSYYVEWDDETKSCYFAEGLQPYKEETMEEELIPRIDFNKYCKDKYLLDLGNYEIKEENGKTYAVCKQFKYPTTYEECCYILGITYSFGDCYGYRSDLISFLQELLICRDAYRKIAGWEPTKDDEGETFSLFYNRSSDEINKCEGLYESNAILDFPTKEMRDAFYENFKELINQCKELL